MSDSVNLAAIFYEKLSEICSNCPKLDNCKNEKCSLRIFSDNFDFHFSQSWAGCCLKEIDLLSKASKDSKKPELVIKELKRIAFEEAKKETEVKEYD